MKNQMATTAIREKPILFSGPMVRAILDGQKIQTRRVVQRQPRLDGDGVPYILAGRTCRTSGEIVRRNKKTGDETSRPMTELELIEAHCKCPYGGVGDRLWVRETWVELLHTSPATDEPLLCDGDKLIEHATFYMRDGVKHWHYDGKVVSYRATSDVEFCDGDGFTSPDFANKDDMPRWRPSIHMPRWASRIDLEITGVRVERLQGISNEDAVAEGFQESRRESYGRVILNSPKCNFRELWDSINAKRGYGWDANPFVWVIEFKQIANGAAP